MLTVGHLIAVVVGLILGSMITFCVMWKPTEKGFREGWKRAKEMFSDWDQGFSDGWNSCFKLLENIIKEKKNADKH